MQNIKVPTNLRRLLSIALTIKRLIARKVGESGQQCNLTLTY